VSLFDHPRFHLLRHGQTAHNAADVIAGSTDAPLTDAGRAQARQAALALRDLPIGPLIASPLQRAWQTAEAIAALRPDLRIIAAPLLAERDWGIWEGAPRAILDRDATPEGGESPAAFHARILQGCAAIASPDAGHDRSPDAVSRQAPPLLVVHSGTIRVVMAALGLPFLRPSNCAWITVRRDPRGCWCADPPADPPADPSAVAPDPLSQPSRLS